MKNKSDEYWKGKLSDEQYQVLRGKGTETPFSGALLDNNAEGLYNCAACGAGLFSSDKKYDSRSGWPSFTDVASNANVELHEDRTHGMIRTEVVCGNCGSHLGHAFPDGPRQNGELYCINSVSLDFEGENNERA